MFRNEVEFRRHVAKLLPSLGFKILSREFGIRERLRVDIYAARGDKSAAIEVKSGRRGLEDDISKCHTLHRYPEFDEVYVAAPRIVISGDHIGFAQRSRVGLFGVETEELIELVTSGELRAPMLNCGHQYPSKAALPGEMVAISMDVTNMGEKAARDVTMYFMPAAPFSRGPKAKRTRRLLLTDEQWREAFEVRVQKNAKPGRYPLAFFCSAMGIDARPYVLDLKIGARSGDS